MKNIIILIFILTVGINYGQTVLNSTDLDNLNLSYNTYEANSNSLNQGSSGLNVTWNFSSLQTTLNGPNSYETVLTAPYSSSFPTTNYFVKIDNISYIYSIKSSLKSEVVGGSFGTNVSVPYPNPATQWVFPFAYNASFTDTYQEDSSSSVSSRTVLYDGYGTVITPFASYADCMRFKVTENGSVSYVWYKSNPFRGIAGCSSTGVNSSFSFFEYTNLSIDSFKKSNINLFPNPVVDIINIENIDSLNFDSVFIKDVLGKNVYYDNDKVIKKNINVESFNKGVYFLTYQINGDKNTVKFIKQ